MKPGEVVGQRFEIEREAGSGGMGVVYRARDLRGGVPVALKVLLGHRSEQVARFAREAQVLAGLDHPAVVRYVAQGATPEGHAFLAMEWLEGEPLSARIGRGRLSLHDAMALAFRIAEALAAAHRAGIVHRDLKPSNIMLCGGEIARAKLVDFGIARVVDRTHLTETGAMLGTIGYMAPEQTRGEREIDARADVFALGGVLFRCLVGRTPFEDAEPLAMLLRQTTEDAPRLSTVLDAVPPPLDDLVARMLARAPAERPPDGVVLLDELRRLGYFPPGPPLRLRGTPSAPPSSVEGRTARERQATTAVSSPIRRTVVAVAIAVLLTAVAALVVFLVILPRSGPTSFSSTFSPRDCLAERCEHIDLPNPAAVDITQVVPKVRAMVQAIDRSAALVGVATSASIKNGLVDTNRVQILVMFRVAAAGRSNRNTIAASVSHGRVDIQWLETAYEMKNLPDPRCPLPRVAAAAKARGVWSDAGMSYSYAQFPVGMGWSVTVVQPKVAQVTVRDATCEAY